MSSPDQVVGEESAPATLSELGTRFAEDVSNRVARVVELDRPFSALANPETGRVAVAIYDNDGTELSIPLRIDGSVKLRLLIKFKCCWDTPAAYLAIDESMFHLRLSDRARDADNPLFRYEYLRQAKKNVPSAHLQVHAHRDEFVYLLAAGTRARVGDR